MSISQAGTVSPLLLGGKSPVKVGVVLTGDMSDQRRHFGGLNGEAKKASAVQKNKNIWNVVNPESVSIL